ncbi:hypothetical protein [Xanthomonas graminis]|uniref:hypothetical protein n=1 Tax=Xanthomonas graminis TaxID=3390026 RepID=UPI00118763F2|nr:hypothetical protein [Xanthomonas translucens]UKE64612.1 hypothetical protein KM547_12630 [Xanthomonas translucens pv. phlei]UKE74688.1 hypothetical protein KFS85_07315 [Xanthomonas translucens pv. phleipratensis]
MRRGIGGSGPHAGRASSWAAAWHHGERRPEVIEKQSLKEISQSSNTAEMLRWRDAKFVVQRMLHGKRMSSTFA